MTSDCSTGRPRMQLDSKRAHGPARQGDEESRTAESWPPDHLGCAMHMLTAFLVSELLAKGVWPTTDMHK